MAILDTAELVLRANRYSRSGVWLDESGNGHDATPVGSPSWDGVKFTLDGATQYFTVPDDPGLNFADGEDFTAVAVVTPSELLTQVYWIVGKKSGISTFGIGWQLSIDNAQRMVVQMYDGTVFVAKAISGMIAGTTYTAAARLNGNTASVKANESIADVDASALDSLANSTNLTIGVRGLEDSLFFNGDIYGVALFRTALSDQDIEQAGQELIAAPAGPSNRMGGTGAIRRKGGPRP